MSSPLHALRRTLSGLLLGIGALASPILAQAEDDQTPWWRAAYQHTESLINEGQRALLVSGYAHHGRGTYTPDHLAELNERAWGLGFSADRRDLRDNEETLFGMLISDSHYKPQPMVGYAYQWMKPLGSTIETGAGVAGLLISRTDYFSGFPFPAVLPVASIGTRHNKLMAAYVPRLSKNKNNGDVLLIFARFDLD